MITFLALQRSRQWALRLADDQGAATAEYAIATMAAVGLAGVLVTILRGGVVKALLEGLITSALHVAK